ncbi:hypothetical protein [Rubinisphaera brasiliensis]|nr:hypothetical protein [Rubinisphaera brasiliensis]
MMRKSLLCLALAVSGLVGCGSSSDGPELISVSGQVMLDGQPLQSGSILFKDPEGKARSYFATIEDGTYETRIETGKRRVEVSAIRSVPGKMVPNAEGDGMEPASEQYLPAEYNKLSTLEIEVDHSGENDFDFELNS